MTKLNKVKDETDIVKYTTYKISGGIHPVEFKTLSNQKPIKELQRARILTIPLTNSSQLNGELQVEVGEDVYDGQVLLISEQESIASNIHSPCDGKVLHIDKRNTGHPSGLLLSSICIDRKSVV